VAGEPSFKMDPAFIFRVLERRPVIGHFWIVST
jgi:hypothetical protein